MPPETLSNSPTIRAYNPAAPERVRASILDMLRNVAAFPRIGRSENISGVRKIVTRKYPYPIRCTTNDETHEVVILTIQHPAPEPQDVEPWTIEHQRAERLGNRSGRLL